MDPNVALQNAEVEILAGEFDLAQRILSDYRKWRKQGGFEPKNGDMWASDMERRISEKN